MCVLQSGRVMCRRMVCDCDNPTLDLFCCPECDPRLTSQCLHQNGLLIYSSGDTWIDNCQRCQCLVRPPRFILIFVSLYALHTLYEVRISAVKHTHTSAVPSICSSNANVVFAFTGGYFWTKPPCCDPLPIGSCPTVGLCGERGR